MSAVRVCSWGLRPSTTAVVHCNRCRQMGASHFDYIHQLKPARYRFEHLVSAWHLTLPKPCAVSPVEQVVGDAEWFKKRATRLLNAARRGAVRHFSYWLLGKKQGLRHESEVATRNRTLRSGYGGTCTLC